MVLNGDELRTQSLIFGGIDSNYRAASYDLTIDVFIGPDGRYLEEYEIPPQGIIKIVSREHIAMPRDLIGYVLVKTSLCNEGILALNIGIVDPGYTGPLTSTLINFGKSKQRLRRGDAFSRLSVHRVKEGDFSKVEFKSCSQARREAVDQVDRFLGDSFLDIKRTASDAAERAFGQFKTQLFWALPALAFVISVLTLALNFGNMWLVQHYFQPKDQVRAEAIKVEMANEISKLNAQTDALRQAMKRLEEKASHLPVQGKKN